MLLHIAFLHKDIRTILYRTDHTAQHSTWNNLLQVTCSHIRIAIRTQSGHHQQHEPHVVVLFCKLLQIAHDRQMGILTHEASHAWTDGVVLVKTHTFTHILRGFA